jgi:hypothetical protein
VNGRLILLIFLLGSLFLVPSLTNAEFIFRYGPRGPIIRDFVMVSSNQSSNILTRTFNLKVENKSQEPLYNVKATLIHASDQVTIIEKEVFCGTINPGEIRISNDVFTYSVDLFKTSLNPEINLHWKIEYDDSKGRKTGEALVKETF